jgi:hypothetical protein
MRGAVWVIRGGVQQRDEEGAIEYKIFARAAFRAMLTA